MLDALLFIIHHLSTPLFMVNAARIIIPLISVCVGCYLLIIHPQKQDQRRLLITAQHLHPGTVVKTANNLCGTIICTTTTTVIIELESGQKVEILKQTITDIVA